MASNTVTLSVGTKGTRNVVNEAKAVKTSWVDTAAKLSLVWNALTPIVGAFTSALSESIKAAAQFSKDSAQLDAALRAATPNAKAVRQQFDAFALSLQEAAGVSQDTVTNLQKMFVQLSGNTDMANEAAQATMALASATGVTANEAIKSISLSMSGQLGQLGELVPAVKNFTQEQLKSGAAIKLVAEKFGPALLANMETTAGQYERLSNIIVDQYLEQVGIAITSNTVFAAGLKEVGTRLSGAGLQASDMADILGDAAVAAVTLAGTLVDIGVGGVRAVLELKIKFDNLIGSMARAAATVSKLLGTESFTHAFEGMSDDMEQSKNELEGLSKATFDYGETMLSTIGAVRREMEKAQKSGQTLKSLMPTPKEMTKAAEVVKAIDSKFIDELIAQRDAARQEEANRFEEQAKAYEARTAEMIESSAAVVNQFGSTIGTAMADVVTGTKTATEAIQGMFAAMGAQIVGIVTNMAVTSITAMAADAAVKAGSAMAAIPFIGPALAVSAAGALFSSLIGFAAKAKGNFFGGVVTGGVPGRDSVPIMAAPGETVRTREQEKTLQKQLRSPAAQGAGGQTNVSIQLMGQTSRAETRRWLQDVVVPEMRLLGVV